MSDEELEQHKLRAEIAKLQAETELLHRRVWFSFAEFVKVTGAIIATVAGLYAAITTYRITQLETRLAVAEREQAEKDRVAAVAARETARVELSHAAQAKASAERELATLLAKVQAARDEIAKVTGSAGGQRVDVASLLSVSGNLASASERAGRSLPYVFIVPATESQEAFVASAVTLIANAGIRSSASRPLKDVRNAPASTEVHYFQTVDQAEAERIAELLRQAGIEDARSVQTPRADVTRYRYYELRLPIRTPVLRSAA